MTEAAKMVTWPALAGRYGGIVCGRSGFAATIRRQQFSATVLSLMVRARYKGCGESCNPTLRNFKTIVKDSCTFLISGFSRAIDHQLINQSVNQSINQSIN